MQRANDSISSTLMEAIVFKFVLGFLFLVELILISNVVENSQYKFVDFL